MAQKKVPMRMCVGCREMRPKRELVRVVRSPEGVVEIDTVGRAPGRGAYLCKNPACLQKAIKTHALERTYEQKIDADVYRRLEEEFTAYGSEQA